MAVDVEKTFEWLVNGAPGARTPMGVLGRMCPELREAGLPLDRLEAFVRTLHPHIAGRSFLWTPPGPVEVIERSFSALASPEFERSAVAEVFRSGQMMRHHLEAGETGGHPELETLKGQGFTDFATAPMPFLNGQVHAITFATRRPGGFTDDDRRAVMRVMPPLTRIGEILALSRTATNLLNTYVGHDAGERILAGQIQRGDTNSIRAVIWFSDLRGFTSMSSALTPGEIIATLNDVFDCQVPAIEKRGGEVLKYMGDGMLAIFPVDGALGRPEGAAGPDRAQRAARVDDAVAATREAFAALAALNERRAHKGQPPVRFGVALHVGEIAYGNIGGSGRLDFTCIGPAVNLAARLETLTGKLGRDVVLSEEVAGLTEAPLEDLGAFELKGVGAPSRAFAPISAR